MSRDSLSADSLSEATRSRAKFSGHGNAKGAAGYRIDGRTAAGEFLSDSGETAIINPHEHGYEQIKIGAAWDEMLVTDPGLLGKLFKRQIKKPVDIDLGCLYELQNGERGCVQAFGNMYGLYNQEPYIHLSGDERTGESVGNDEYIKINGQKWPDIKRLVVYVYIYEGVPHWASVRPQIQIFVPGEEPLVIIPDVHKSSLPVCVIGEMQNVRNGIKLINHTEYFPGHSEMDRAYGFGLEWGEGQKS